jgi:hypothetical protein
MMRWFRIAMVALAISAPGFGFVSTVSAQSLIGSSKECGTYEFDGDLVKGRTDGMVVRVDHTEGCYRYKFMTIVGTGLTEGYGYPGQQAMCEKAGREAAVGHFRYYRGMEIDPSSVKVSCTNYAGPD